MILDTKGLEGKFKWKDELNRQKGGEHALDPIGDPLSFVACWINDRLHVGRNHSSLADHCRHRVSGPTYSGTKSIVAGK